MIYRLKNPLKNYAWGSRTAMTERFGFANPDDEPQAELWLGAHAGGCSIIQTPDGEQRLDDFIANAPKVVLGEVVATRFVGLPFLLKILAAETPLSIQVHPNKAKAEAGFARENRQGIDIAAGHRHYKDPNHKPELIYALSDFAALNGFRDIPEMLALFDVADVPTLTPETQAFKKQPDAAGLAHFFAAILSLQGKRKTTAINELLNGIDNKGDSDCAQTALAWVKRCSELYPDDVGLFAPLLLNVITLGPGQAMFLHAETPHAYLHGLGIEIMASSDNVLRAGLTPKHIDIAELLDNISYQPMPLKSLATPAVVDGKRRHFPVPVTDFAFDIIDIDGENAVAVHSAEILLCLSGEIEIAGLRLSTGESVFVTADTGSYTLSGQGQVVRAYNAI